MTEAALSYAHGASNVALIGETIGRQLRPDRCALGRPAGADRAPAGHPVELPRTGREGRCVRRRAARAGTAAGRADRHLVAEQRRMGGDAVRHRQGRADPGQHQPGLSAGRTGIRAEQGGLPGADHRDRVQDQRLYRHDQHAGAGTAVCAARPPGCGEAAGAGDGDPDRRCARAGHDPVRRASAPWRRSRIARGWRSWRRGCSSTIRSTSSSPPARPACRRAPR